MKQLILLITIFSSILLSNELKLSKEDLEQIKKNPRGTAILKRFEALKNLKIQSKNKTIMRKLIDTNLFFNQTMPMFDNNKYDSDDYWATRKEFLMNGEGDCEDYVISKYFTLLELGISKDELYLSVVKVDKMIDYHMVLLYKDKKNNKLLVMDNLSFRILPLEKRVDLIPIVAFNELETRLIEKNSLGEETKINWGKVDKWKEFLSRAYPSKI